LEAGSRILLLTVIWVAISSASILVVLSRAPGEVCAFWRLFLSSLILLTPWLRGRRRLRWYHVVSGVGLSLHFILWMKSLFLVPVYTSTLLVVLYPLYTLVVDVVAYGYRPTLLQVLGFTGGVLSLLLFLGLNSIILNQGAILSLLAGLAVTLYFEIGKYARGGRGESLAEYAFPTYMTATLVTLLYNLVARTSLLPGSPVAYVYFVLMAFIPMMLGHTLMNYLLRYYPTHIVTSVSLGEPFGAGLLAYIILGQEIPLHNIITGIATVLSMVAIIYGYSDAVK